jgi:hypothetical protein
LKIWIKRNGLFADAGFQPLPKVPLRTAPNVAGEGRGENIPSAAASPREWKTEERATEGSEDEGFDSLPGGRAGADKFSRALS